MSEQNPLAMMAEKLSRLRALGDAEIAAIKRLTYRMEYVPARRLLVREGDVPVECCVLVAGYACRYKMERGGSRQIVSFHLPGDLLDVQHLQLPTADHNVATISETQIAWVPMRQIRALVADHPHINEALWRDALIDASIFREWVLNLGRRDAKTRISHMLCEFAARRSAAGLGEPEEIDLPMSQEEIADATGLTSVHVNRTLQALRREGAVGGRGRRMHIQDWEQLKSIAGFDPAYLHQAA